MLLRVSWAGGLALGESALFLPIEFDELLKAKNFLVVPPLQVRDERRPGADH